MRRYEVSSLFRAGTLAGSLVSAFLLLAALQRALSPAAAQGKAAAERPGIASGTGQMYLPFLRAAWQDSPFEFVASFGGSIQASAISGTLAFVGEGAGLTTMDVSNASAPAPLARLPLPAPVNDLQLDGGLSYLATERGLAVVDLQDPLSPRPLSYFPIATGARAIFVAGQHAFLAVRESGLLILDVSDPARPTFRGVYPENAYEVWVENDLAYVVGGSYATGDGDLKILDVSDPENPLVIGGYEDQAVRDIQVVSDLAYIVDADGLSILDVSVPVSPTLLGSYESYVDRMRIVGDHAYLLGSALVGLTASCTFSVVDVSDPGQPMPVSDQVVYTSSIGCSGDVQHADNKVYFSRGSFHIFDVTIPDNPVQRGVYSLLPTDIQLEGPLVYLTAWESGLNILNVSDPLEPVRLSSYQTDGYERGVRVVGNRAYLTTWIPCRFCGGRFQVLDVSDPAHPASLGNLSILAGPSFVIEGDRAYLREIWVGLGVYLTVLDVSDPLSPTQILAYLPGPYTLYSLDAVGHTAYLGLYHRSNPEGDELRILDTSDPSNPIVQGSVPISRSLDLAVVDSLVFSASPEAGLQIVDVGNPSHPVLISTFEVPGTAVSVHPVRGGVYLADGDLQWIEVSDPKNPQLLATFRTVGSTESVHVAGDRVYVVDRVSGVQVLTLEGWP